MNKKITPLEALETLVYGLTNDNYKKEDLGITMSKCREIIKTALKALEIIKKKNVDVGFLRYSSTLETYNAYIIEHAWTPKKLTQEEYDLLKEVLL